MQHRAGLDRVEVAHQLVGRLVAVLRLLLQAAQDDGLDLVADAADDVLGQHRLVVAVLVDQGVGRRAVERLLPGGDLVEHHAERVQVAAAVHRAVATALLGTDVGRRADRLAGHGQVVLAQHLDDAEVGQLQVAVLGHHHVGRLDVAVHDAVAPGLGQALGRLQHVAQRLVRGQRLVLVACFLDDVVEVGAVHELHGVEVIRLVLADVIDLHDMRADQLGRGLRLEMEAVQQPGVGRQVGRQYLDRDAALQRLLLGAVHRAHAALAKDAADLEVAPGLPGVRTLAALQMPGVIERHRGAATGLGPAVEVGRGLAAHGRRGRGRRDAGLHGQLAARQRRRVRLHGQLAARQRRRLRANRLHRQLAAGQAAGRCRGRLHRQLTPGQSVGRCRGRLHRQLAAG